MNTYSKHIRLICLTGLICVTVSLWHGVTAHAQSTSSTPSTGLAVSPPTFELTGNPGDTIKNTIKLENMNTYPVEIAVDRRNFTAIGEEGAVGLTEDETSFSLAAWVEITPTLITLPPKSTQFFNFSLKVPLNAEPGGHFGSIIFRTIPQEKIEGSGASLAQEIGSLILLRVAGEAVEQAKIESFQTTRQIYEFGPVDFEVRLKNLGNVHLKPRGTISITNLLGQKVATITPDNKNVLPGAIRKVDASWDAGWRLGHYTATYIALLGNDTQLATVTSFTIVPYRLILVIIVIVTIIYLILRKHRKRLALAWKILKSGKA